MPESYEIEGLEPFKEALVQQISRLLQFFYAGSEFNRVDQVVLAGGCAPIPGVAEMVEEQLGVQTVVANPAGQMTLGPRGQAHALADRTGGAEGTRVAGRGEPRGSRTMESQIRNKLKP